MARKIKLYQTYNEDCGLADCLFHTSKKERDRALRDVDNFNHDSCTEFEIELSAKGIVDFISKASFL